MEYSDRRREDRGMKSKEIICKYQQHTDGNVSLEYIGEVYAFIRCADCIHFDDGRNSKCHLSNMRVSGDDYCSKGRAK